MRLAQADAQQLGLASSAWRSDQDRRPGFSGDESIQILAGQQAIGVLVRIERRRHQKTIGTGDQAERHAFFVDQPARLGQRQCSGNAAAGNHARVRMEVHSKFSLDVVEKVVVQSR